MPTFQRIGLALFLALVASQVGAVPITYDFTVAAFEGPLAGVSATGRFSFDSSLTSNTENRGPFLSSLSFRWNGIDYSTSNAQTSVLDFTSFPNPQLELVVFGTNCAPSICSLIGGTNGWIFSAFPLDPLSAGNEFVYVTPTSGADSSHGRITLTPVPNVVSEPQTMGLALTAACALLGSRRFWHRVKGAGSECAG